MAAKKAPMRKTMAKPATRKTAPKNTSSAVRKANAAKKARPTSAAAFRKAEEASKKKQSQRTRVSSANAAENRANKNRYMSQKTLENASRTGEYWEAYDGPVRGGKKTAMDARKKDSKFGRLVGPTTAEAGQISKNRRRENQYTQSVFEDARGDQWVIERSKTNRRFLPDTNRKPSIMPYRVKPTSAAAFRKAESAKKKKK
jgi:hypothetical protein